MSEQNQEQEQVKQQLKVAREELDSFIFSIGHDLRSPLTHIAGFLGILEAKISPKLDDKERELFKVVSDATQRMGKMLEEILEISNLIRKELTLRTVNINEMIEEILIELRLKIQDRKIVWKIGTLPKIKADAILMKQALMHLMDNAIKFTQPSEEAVVIEIDVAPHDQTKKDQAVIFIKDNGVGFDQQYAKNLFGIFQRLHSLEAFPGLGVGLAKTQRIIHLHGGSVWAKSEPGKGATFYFSVPS